MQRIVLAAAAVCVTFGNVESARAVCADDFAYYVKRGYYRNEAWPWPYVCPDRIAVREPFCVMINNGWRRQNLLGPHHFNADATQLTTAGELRVQWIMTQAPPDRRSIFVERSTEADVTQQRLATVRDYTGQIPFGGPAPLVADTHLMSEGRPAAVVDATNVRFQESMMPPKLPALTVGVAAGQ